MQAPRVHRDGDLMMKQQRASSAAAPKKHVSSVPDIVEEKRTSRGTDGSQTSKLHYRYKKERFLGKGGFAKCYQFRRLDKSERVFAAKVVGKSSLTKSRAKQKVGNDAGCCQPGARCHRPMSRYMLTLSRSLACAVFLALCRWPLVPSFFVVGAPRPFCCCAFSTGFPPLARRLPCMHRAPVAFHHRRHTTIDTSSTRRSRFTGS